MPGRDKKASSAVDLAMARTAQRVAEKHGDKSLAQGAERLKVQAEQALGLPQTPPPAPPPRP